MATGELPSQGDPNQPAVPPSFAPWGDPAVSPVGPIEAQLVDKPVRWREGTAVVAAVVLVDLVLWRGGGYAGWAVFFAAMSGLLALGGAGRRTRRSAWLVAVMALAVCARLVWCGGGGAVAVGWVLLIALAGTLAGLPPYMSNLVVLVLQILPAGAVGLSGYIETLRRRESRGCRGPWIGLAVLMPIAAVLLFGALFILANPDFLEVTSRLLTQWRDTLAEWLRGWIPSGPEILVWLATAWAVLGLLRPMLRQSIAAPPEDAAPPPAGHAAADSGPSRATPYYAALRNTLMAVIVLFAVYLCFEYRRLWFGAFPEGFGYSSFAHEGAAWLTLALAVATAVLSAMFRGAVLTDPRGGRLRRLAWLWSAENLLLAASVYNRLHITA